MTTEQRHALKLIGEVTRGRFDIDMLTGPHNAALRARIMTGLTGAITPQAKAGVTRMFETLCSLAGGAVPGNVCLAAKRAALAAWARDVQECQNCGCGWALADVGHIQDYAQRVAPGEPAPSGECPGCGCLCHPIARKAVAA